jgi:hypothetical protein
MRWLQLLFIILKKTCVTLPVLFQSQHTVVFPTHRILTGLICFVCTQTDKEGWGRPNPFGSPNQNLVISWILVHLWVGKLEMGNTLICSDS